MNQKSINRFFSKVDKSQGPLGCWNWIGAKKISGYGIFCKDYKQQRSHRISFNLMYGNMIHEKPCVCHKCDNPSCVNPLHLFLGTLEDNNNDRIRKGRTSCLKGEANGGSILKNQDVLLIRKLIKEGKTRKQLSVIFNISYQTVKVIQERKLWKHLPIEDL